MPGAGPGPALGIAKQVGGTNYESFFPAGSGGPQRGPECCLPQVLPREAPGWSWEGHTQGRSHVQGVAPQVTR